MCSFYVVFDVAGDQLKLPTGFLLALSHKNRNSGIFLKFSKWKKQ